MGDAHKVVAVEQASAGKVDAGREVEMLLQQVHIERLGKPIGVKPVPVLLECVARGQLFALGVQKVNDGL